MILLKDIAARVNGRLVGNEDTEIIGVSSIKNAQPGDLTFLTHPGYRRYLKGCKASAIIVSNDTPLETPDGMSVIMTDHPDLAYIKTAELFAAASKPFPGADPRAILSEETDIAASASVAPYVYIGLGSTIEADVTIHPFVSIGEHVTIRKGSTIYPHVTIYSNTFIGERVVVHAGTVIGSDGFGYTWDGSKHAKIPHLGQVVIEDDVEIGANVTIDRAPLGQTIIGKGTKIDNLVQIAHGVVIGEHSIIVSQVGIGGSVTIGKHVVLAGQAGVRDHIVIGDNVMAAGRTGIIGDVPSNSLVSGFPQMPHKEWLKLNVYLKKLPLLFQRMRRIEDKLHTEDGND